MNIDHSTIRRFSTRLNFVLASFISIRWILALTEAPSYTRSVRSYAVMIVSGYHYSFKFIRKFLSNRATEYGSNSICKHFNGCCHITLYSSNVAEICISSHIAFKCSRRSKFLVRIGDTNVPEMTEDIRITFGKSSEIFWLSSWRVWMGFNDN